MTSVFLRLPPSSFIPWSIRCSTRGTRGQSSHLLGHFTSNCCGCLDTRLMMQPGLEIILMSLLIRKNSKIANFHCPYNTKYTQKISIHSDSDVGQKYLSRLIIKILFPNSQKPRKHIYNICFPANICDTIRTLVTELLDPGGMVMVRTSVNQVVLWALWGQVGQVFLVSLCSR